MNHGFETSYVDLFEPRADGSPLVKAIRIPILQRDYVQGRSDRKVARIRHDFVQALREAIDGGPPLGLDFVWGDVDGGVLEPLDGQQRLTTLFLIHVHLAHRRGALSPDEPWTRFSYVTRPSARKFCQRLVSKAPPPEIPLRSDWITDQPWYLHTWKHDPTVQGALVMLDAIHEAFADIDADAAWARLTHADPGRRAVTFHVLAADRLFGEQLYIRMNSRGKPLTEFENFKARFEQMVEKGISEDKARDLAHRIDGPWSALLWPYRDSGGTGDMVIDDEFLRYFHFVTEVLAVLDGQAPSLDVEGLAEAVYGPNNPRRAEHLDHLIAAFEAWAGLDDDEHPDENVIAAWFDARVTPFDRDRPRSDDTTKCAIVADGPDLFGAACQLYGLPKGRGRAFSLPHTLYLYAAVRHRMTDSPDFADRFRTLRNLVESSSDELRLSTLARHLEDVEAVIVDDDLDAVTSLNRAQLSDEQTKRILLTESPELREPLYQLEDHPLLRGNLAAFELNADTLAGHAHAFLRLFDGRAHYPALTGALVACGPAARPLNPIHPRFFQMGSATTPGPWREFLGSASRDRMGVVRRSLRVLLEQVVASGLHAGEADPGALGRLLESLRDQYVASCTKAGTWTWRTYLAAYPEMREGRSGRYVGWKGQLGYRLCMMEKLYMNSWYRDPYLLAIYRGVDAPDRLRDPWYTSYESKARWLTLERSGGGLRSTRRGLKLASPRAKRARERFEAICVAHGAEPFEDRRSVLPIAKTTLDGSEVDVEDRVEKGIVLVRALLAARL